MNKRELKSQKSIDIQQQMEEIMQSYHQKQKADQFLFYDKYQPLDDKYYIHNNNNKPIDQILERSRTEEKPTQIIEPGHSTMISKVNNCESLLQDIKDMLLLQKQTDINQQKQQTSTNNNMHEIYLTEELSKYKAKYKKTKQKLEESERQKVYLEKQIKELQSVIYTKNDYNDKQQNSNKELNRIIQINHFLSFLLDLQAQLGVTVNITSYFPNTQFQSHCKLISQNEFSFSKKDIIGQGGFSTVYKGIYQYKEVAIKVCDIEQNELQGMLEELFAQLSLDQYTVRLFAVHVPSFPPIRFPLKFHLIMELMYKNLFTLFLVNKIQLPIQQKIQLLIRILEGMDYLHSHNFVHCDLSLANIMVDEQLNNVKLLDFGLAKYLQKGKTKKTVKLGQAARYSPREYLLSGGDNQSTVSTKCDIWSFGVIAYEILTEKQSWSCLQPNQIMVKIIQGVPFFDENPKLGISSFDAILEKCLNHEYQLRPSASELKYHFLQLQ